MVPPPATARRASPNGPARAIALVGLLLIGAGLLGALPSPAAVSVRASAAGTTDAFVNVTTTEAVTFVPSSFTVPPGSTVHLIVTQAADFNHTFTLSPVTDFAFASTAGDSDLATFFAAHTPLVNLSLGHVPGSKHYVNFTAPAAGSYEFVCLESGHFASGMHGTMDASAASSSSGSSFPWALVAGVVGVVIVVAVVAVVLMRRKPKAPS